MKFDTTKYINSVDNDEIKLVCSLSKAKYRTRHRLFTAEGLRAINTLLSSPVSVNTIYYTKNANQGLLVGAHCQLVQVNEQVMSKMSNNTTPPGLLAVCAIPNNKPVRNLSCNKYGLVLTRISDPGNMGTIIRTAAAMAISSIIVVEGVDPWHPKVVQASAGTIGMVDISCCNWQEVYNELKDCLCALVVRNGKPFEEIDISSKCFLVIGSEAHGIPNDWLKDCAWRATLAMPGKTESLNASVAASIALYQLYIRSLRPEK